PEEWRRGTSHDITFSYNLLAEGLADSSHPKGEHSKGSLIHDNATGILIYRNVYAHNMERSPLLKGGVQAAVVNNLIFDPGAQAIHYNLMDLECGDHPHQDGMLSAVGNVLRGGAPAANEVRATPGSGGRLGCVAGGGGGGGGFGCRGCALTARGGRGGGGARRWGCGRVAWGAVSAGGRAASQGCRSGGSAGMG